MEKVVKVVKERNGWREQGINVRKRVKGEY